MDVVTKEESYAKRRKLFKNIWETAIQIDDKDIMAKPKVIKTLRLDEVDRCVVGRKKKERIKNLRTVCNKILDFCDRQDADEIFYEQMAEVKEPLPQTLVLKAKKIKMHRMKKKVKKAKSLFVPNTTEGDHAKATSSERKDDSTNYTKQSRKNTLPKNMKGTTVVLRSVVQTSSNPDNTETNFDKGKGSVTRRKLVTRKRSKRKKQPVPNESPTRPTGASHKVQNLSALLPGRAIIRRIKQLLTENTIVVTKKKKTKPIISAGSSLVNTNISIA